VFAIDIMNSNVVTVSHDTSARDVIRVLTEHQITGAPVVDDDGALVGVVSLADCVQETERGEAVSGRGLCFHRDLWWDLERDEQKSVMVLDESLKASDLMTPDPFTVSEMAPVHEVVDLMIEKRIHRVVVVLNETISGIITTVDMMKALSSKLKPAVAGLIKD
jgi:CBS domain-containing protein